MAEHMQTWRKKLRLKDLLDITKKELESGKEITLVYEILEKEMHYIISTLKTLTHYLTNT